MTRISDDIVAHYERSSGERGGEKYRNMEGEEADQTPGGCEGKWYLNDIADYSYVQYDGPNFPAVFYG